MSDKRTAFILVAHNTSVQKGLEAMTSLTNELRTALTGFYVRLSYLDGEPCLEDQVSDAVKNGCTRILIFPYFLHEGFHVSKQLPEIVSTLQSTLTGIDIEITEHLGGHSKLLSLITNTAHDYLKRIPQK